MPHWLSHEPILLVPTEHGLRAYEHLELLGSLPGHPRLAVVGSRNAHGRFLRIIDGVVAAAASEHWSIVSGGALGIDAAAHRAALRNHCPQLAVLPCGRDRTYPPGHGKLFTSIFAHSGSGLLFARPAGTEPRRGMFASRNRVVVGLADAVLVAEASLRSGSIGTGRLALAGGHPVAVFAGSHGCAQLIAEGATALPDPEQPDLAIERLVEWLRRALDPSLPAQTVLSAWPSELAWLRDLLRAGGPRGTSLEQLTAAGPAIVALCEAELLGLVGEAAPGRWVALVE